jgi:Peptidase family M23
MLNGIGLTRAALLIAVVPTLAVACSATSGDLPSDEKHSEGAHALGDCGSLDYVGACDGSTLRWCEAGTLMEVDCAKSGRACGWQDDAVGNNCLRGSSGGGDGSTLGFVYPVGDMTTYPAGGWAVSQVLGNWLNGTTFYGGHLAEDIFNPNGATANAPVYAMADGTVLYAGTNSSSYKHTVLIEHYLGNGERICSFYGHLWPPVVYSGEKVTRGQEIASVMDWTYYYPGYDNSHLHYVLVNSDVCDTAYYGSGGVCGYDYTNGPNGITDLSNEPAVYTSIGDDCGTQAFPGGYIAPSQFVHEHRE